MSIKYRQYAPPDFQLVSDFLIANYRPGNRDGNWLQPEWEYMHSHPNLDESSLDRIRIWEHGGAIAGVVHYESGLGEAFFQVHPEHAYLKPTMLDYAEEQLFGTDAEGRRHLQVYMKDFDRALGALVISRGYLKAGGGNRPMSQFVEPRQITKPSLPGGFTLTSLANDNDLQKIHRVLWRGFDHEGEPPPEGIEWRKKMQSGPNFKKELTIVVKGPEGDFVAFCGMWYEPVNRYAYVEPLATDPDYRRMGLAKAAVCEGIRRCVDLGAVEVYVGSDQKFYKAIGFVELFDTSCWVREY